MKEDEHEEYETTYTEHRYEYAQDFPGTAYLII